MDVKTRLVKQGMSQPWNGVRYCDRMTSSCCVILSVSYCPAAADTVPRNQALPEATDPVYLLPLQTWGTSRRVRSTKAFPMEKLLSSAPHALPASLGRR